MVFVVPSLQQYTQVLRAKTDCSTLNHQQQGLLICMFTRTTIHQTSIEFSILRKTWYQMVLTCLLPTLLMQPCCCWCFACCGLHSSIICRCLCIRTFGIGSSQIFHKKKREREREKKLPIWHQNSKSAICLETADTSQ